MSEYNLTQTGEVIQKALDNALNPDTTLTKENVPADAKTIGEKISKLQEDIGDQENQYSALTLRVKNLEDSEGGATEEQIAQIETNKNDIADLKTNKANITDVKAWIIQQTPLFAESKEWLDANGDTSKVYILDGEIYAYMYKESEGPSYTNWLPLATDTDRKTVFNNGLGYINGYRLNSSGVQTSCSGMMVTGFIPVKYGDIIRLKGVAPSTTTYSNNFCFYDSTNTHLAQSGHGKDAFVDGYTGTKGVTFTLLEDGIWELTVDTTQLKCASSITNCDTFRYNCGDFTNAIITVNEEIVDSGSSGGYGWYSTGHTFVPADYEDRIVAIENAIESGEIGGKLEITNIVESTEDGGENIVTFSDGRTLTIKNGKTGQKGQNGSNGENGIVQIEPLFAESVTWLNSNGDTSKLYILPDNYVCAYMDGSWKNTGNQFVSSGGESSVQKYLNDRNTYIAPVPSGFCESLNEYVDYSVKVNDAVSLETQMARFSGLASSYPDYVTETLLGKDASNTYDIYKYELELNPPIDDAYVSVMEKDKPVFIITSGLHGNEHDAVDEVYHFMKDLCENYMDSDYFDYLRNNVKFVIVPISNPWGYTNLTYNNSNDVNLNKNFEHGFNQVTGGTGSQQNTGANAYSETETVLLKGVFDEYSDAIFHLECHGKAQNDTSWEQILWFSNMASLKSELIELCSTRVIHQIGCRLHKLGFNITNSECGWMTYYTLNGRPKDYTGTEYGMLSTTMEGTGRMGVAGHTTYTKYEQQINTEALENFILRVLDSLNSRVEI